METIYWNGNNPLILSKDFLSEQSDSLIIYLSWEINPSDSIVFILSSFFPEVLTYYFLVHNHWYVNAFTY